VHTRRPARRSSSNIGRFGPYIGHDGKFRIHPRTDSIFDIGLGTFIGTCLAQAKSGGCYLARAGRAPDDKAPVEICSGRYGPYARHGKINATLPKGCDPGSHYAGRSLELIAAKAAKGGTGKAKVTKKPAAKKARPKATKEKAEAKPKATVKKATAKTAADKPAVKKTTKTATSKAKTTTATTTKKAAAKPAAKKPAAKKTTKKTA